MRFENLTDVHARRHAQRVEHDVDMRAVFEERHVLDRHDTRHDTLVAVTAGHLVAGLDLALHSDEDLDHLHDARRHFVAALDLLDLVHEALFERASWTRRTGRAGLRARSGPSRLRRRTATTASADTRRASAFDSSVPFLKPFGPAIASWPTQHVDQTAVDVAVEDRLLVVAVLGETLDFLALDRHGALVLFNAVAVEDADFDDRAVGARRHAHGRVADVGGLFAEDGAQKLFFRRHRAFALRRDLADQDIARLNFGADIDDAGFVEVLQRFFRNVRNVARDFFRTELGVARHDLEFLDVDRGEHVVGDDTLGQQDRVLVVVAVPRHERDERVAAERQIAEIGRRTVGDDVALVDLVAHAQPADAG